MVMKVTKKRKRRPTARKQARAKPRKPKVQPINERPVPTDLRDNTIMAIDPGTRRLGWSVSKITCEPPSSDCFKRVKRDWLDRGTVFSHGKGSKVISQIVEQVREIQEQYNIDTLAIEDYVFIPGRSTGIFAVPALIGVLKHDWWTRNKTEPIMIKSPTWKYLICDYGRANKLEVRRKLESYLPEEILIDIEDEFSKNRLKEDQDPQDCFDAIAIDMYVSLSIDRNIMASEVAIDEEEPER